MIAIRYHDFCMGHTVTGHESKCRHYHGHNYRAYFHCKADDQQLDDVGRVIDFSVIKSSLCQWIEDNWDHKFMMYINDDRFSSFEKSDVTHSLVPMPFNPTAENISKYFVEEIAPKILPVGITLVKMELQETRKCGVIYELQN